MAKVLVIAGCGELRHAATTWVLAEAVSARRGAVIAAVVTVATGVLFLLPLIAGVDSGAPRWLAPYLRALGPTAERTAGAGNRERLRAAGRGAHAQLAVGVLLVAALTCGAMLANLLWVAPNANQAFREVVVAASSRGDDEHAGAGRPDATHRDRVGRPRTLGRVGRPAYLAPAAGAAAGVTG